MKRVLLACSAAALLAACSWKPRYTTSDVQPPPTLEVALQAADAARLAGATTLSEDSQTTVTVTRDGAILTALARNRSLLVERLNPDIRRTYIDEQRAAFDPALLATTSFGRTRPRSFDANGKDTVEDQYSTNGNVQLTEKLPTGTALTLAGGMGRNYSDPSGSAYSGNWSAEVSQSLLRGAGTNVGLVALRQARNSSEITAQAFRDSVLELVKQTEDAYWELVLARETLGIREFSVRIAREQLRLAEARLEVGSAIMADVLSARSEVASRNADLVDARANLRQRRLSLLRLLSPESDAQWATRLDAVDNADVTAIALDPAMSTQLALKYRPDLAQAKLSLVNADLDVVRTKNGLLPRLDGFVSYGRRSYGSSFQGGYDNLDSDRNDEYQVGATFEMSPLNRGERARDARARFQRDQAEASIANLEELLALDVRQDIVSAQQQYDRIAATREALASRREEVRAMEARYRVGSATILDTLQTQNNLVQAQVDEITARVRYIQALSALYRDEATLLDRRGVGVPKTPEQVKAGT